MILPAKFHVVSSLLSVLKIAIFDAIIVVPHSKGILTENEKTVKLKSGVSILIMLLNESLPQID